MSAIIARAATRMATAPVSRSFSTGRVLRNTIDSSAAVSSSSRGGIAGIFPRRIGWGGALLIFSGGLADGAVATSWYMSRDKKE